jgi:preprotein translocase subunit SecB
MDKKTFHESLFKTGNISKILIKEHIFKSFDFNLIPGINNTSGMSLANEVIDVNIERDKMTLIVKFELSSKIEENDQKMFELELLYHIIFNIKDIQEELTSDDVMEYFKDQNIMKEIITIIWPYSREILQRNCLNADIPVITLPVI